MRIFSFLFLLAFSLNSFAQDKPAYSIFTMEGSNACCHEMIRKLAKAELEVTKSLFNEKKDELVIGQKCLNRIISC